MRYLSYYEEYSIYEPAEGGYYYAGNQLLKTERKSKRQCRREFEKIWQDCKKENEENGFTEDADWNVVFINTRIHPWVRMNDNYICRSGNYIGEGCSYAIEKRSGSMEHGREWYC